MKASRFVLALVTCGSCALAVAQPYGPSDQERRERNREEAMARHERMSTAHEEMHEGASTVRSKTHHAATKTRSFSHRQLEKVRTFGERQQRKYPDRGHPVEINKTPSALGK